MIVASFMLKLNIFHDFDIVTQGVHVADSSNATSIEIFTNTQKLAIIALMPTFYSPLLQLLNIWILKC